MPVLSPEHVEEIEAERSSLSLAEIARYLQEQLGQKMAAYVAGVNDARMVGRWAAGKHQPHPDVDMRLRLPGGTSARRRLQRRNGEGMALRVEQPA